VTPLEDALEHGEYKLILKPHIPEEKTAILGPFEVDVVPIFNMRW
jgi:hypothetical protein